MAKTYGDELEFEDDLVNILRRDKGWTGEPLRYPTENDLVENWRRILTSMNSDMDRLNGTELTKTEMQQILDQVNRCMTLPR